MSMVRTNHAAAPLRGFAYAAGGLDFDNNLLRSVEKYDPRKDRWKMSKPLPAPRAFAGAATVKGRLYVAGGSLNAGTTRSVVVYNPRTNAWSSVAPMSIARDRMRLLAAGPYLYAVGGLGVSGDALRSVDRYDPRTDSWRLIRPMNEARAVPGATTTRVHGKAVLVVAGGTHFTAGEFGGFTRTAEVFDIGTGRWRTLRAKLPKIVGSYSCATTRNGTVLSIGGATMDEVGDFEFLDEVNALTLRPKHLS